MDKGCQKVKLYKNWVKGGLALVYMKEALKNIFMSETDDENKENAREIPRKGYQKKKTRNRRKKLAVCHLCKCLIMNKTTLRAARQGVNMKYGCNKKDGDLCKVRQARNAFLHSSMMQLGDKELEKIIDPLESIALSMSEGSPAVVLKIKQLKRNDFAITALEQAMAFRELRKSLSVRNSELQLLVKYIAEIQDQKPQSSTCVEAYACPLQENNKILKNMAQILLKRLRGREVSSKPTSVSQTRRVLEKIETEVENLELMRHKLPQHQSERGITDGNQNGSDDNMNAKIAVQRAYSFITKRPHFYERTYSPSFQIDDLKEKKQIWNVNLRKLSFSNEACILMHHNMACNDRNSRLFENTRQKQCQSLSIILVSILMSGIKSRCTLSTSRVKEQHSKCHIDPCESPSLLSRYLPDRCSLLKCRWRKLLNYQPTLVCKILTDLPTLNSSYTLSANRHLPFELLHEICSTKYTEFLEFYYEIKVPELKHLYISALCEHSFCPIKIFNSWCNRVIHRPLDKKEHDNIINDNQIINDFVVNSATNISNIEYHCGESKTLNTSENRDSFTETRKPGTFKGVGTMEQANENMQTVSAVNKNSYMSRQNNPLEHMCKDICVRPYSKAGESVNSDPLTSSEDRIAISDEDKKADEVKQAIKTNLSRLNEYFTYVDAMAITEPVEMAIENLRHVPTNSTNTLTSIHSKTSKSIFSSEVGTVDLKTEGNEPSTIFENLTTVFSEDEETDTSGDRQLIDDSLNSTTKLSDIGYNNEENKALNQPENHIRFMHCRKPDNMHSEGTTEQVDENLQTVSAFNTNSLIFRKNIPSKHTCKDICERSNSKAGESVHSDPLTRSEDRNAISREDKKVDEVKQAIKTNLSPLNESSINVVVPAITRPVEEANENQKNISADDTISLTREHNNTSKSMCTHQAGTVNLKTGVNEPFTTSEDPTVISSEDEETDVVKQAITMNLPHMNFSSTFVVAPAFKGPSEKQGLNDNTSDDNTNRARIGSPNGSAEENAEAVCGAESETQSPQRNASNAIDSVSVDACERESFTEQLRYNTSLPTVEHNENIVVANASGAYGSAMCRDTIQTSFKESEARFNINKDVQVVQKSASSDEFSNTEDNNHSSENSQQSTPAADQTYTSDFPNPAVEISDIQSFEPLMEIVDKIADGERVPPQITMRYEMLRFCTLRSYPKVNKPYITRLAQAGFYYANSSDEVVCYTCARRKRNWQETDIPMDVHRQLNPNCKFLLRNSEVNVPIRADAPGSDMLATLQARFNVRNTNSSSAEYSTAQRNQNNHRTETDTLSGLSERTIQYSLQLANRSSTASRSSNQSTVQQDASVSSSHTNYTLPRMQIRAHGNFVQSTGSADSDGRTLTAATGNALEPLGSGSETTVSQTAGAGGSQSTMPKYPKYASKTVRTTSFNDCNEIVVSPQSLSEAGFFYAGFGDCVRCFQCGVGLRHWSEEDDPWIEHSRWSKDCSYVKQVRGQEFVNLVQMAVQYSQNQSNQENNEHGQSEAVAGSNQGANGGDEVENLLHKDSAQSVLEMGYHPDIIRRAIRAVLEVHGREGVTAANLMEKIFEIEEAETPTRTEQNGEVLGQRNQSSQRTTTPNQQSEQSNPEIQAAGASSNNNDSQRPAQSRETHGSEGQSATASENTESSSKSSNAEAVNTSKLSDSREMTRVSKKQQLLEKKKLKEENEKLKQQSICTNCKEKDVCIVFLPCGHLVTCETCAPKVRYCSVETCKKYIKGTVRTYLA